MSESDEVKIAIMGSASVGKSAITQRFVNNTFYTTYEPTISDTYNKTMEAKGQQISVEIMDTAGTEQFRTMSQFYMTSASGFIVVFSYIEKESLQFAMKTITEIRTTRTNDFVPIFLVGNKNDIVEDRQVTKEMVQEAESTSKCPSYRVSAKTGENVSKVFEDLVKIMFDPPAKKRKCKVF